MTTTWQEHRQQHHTDVTPIIGAGYRASCTCGWWGPFRNHQQDAARDAADHDARTIGEVGDE